MLENAAARELSARSAHGLDGDVRRDVVPAGATRTYTKAMAYVLADQRGGGGRWAPGQVLDGGLFDVAFLDQAMPMPQVQRMTDFAWPMTVDREDVETSELVGFDELGYCRRVVAEIDQGDLPCYMAGRPDQREKHSGGRPMRRAPFSFGAHWYDADRSGVNGRAWTQFWTQTRQDWAGLDGTVASLIARKC